MEPLKTAIVDAGPTHLRVRGHDVLDLMRQASFTDLIYMLHHDRLPTAAEPRLIEAILIGVADHGPGGPSCAAARLAASANRQSLSAAIAAGVLTIGDEHGGAGSACMEMIAAGLERAPLSVEEAARLTVQEAIASRKRLPGLGHRVHSVDPRTAVLFGMAREEGVAGKGIEFIEALGKSASELIRPLPINIDGALAAVLFDLGF